MAKGDLLISVLEKIVETAGTIPAVIEGILTAGYGASASKMEYHVELAKRQKDKKVRESDYKQKYWALLYKLKKDGLVEERGGKVLNLTKEGKEKLRKLKERRSNFFPKNYTATSSQAIILVAFDIPEIKKRERSWLRENLKIMGFSILQKSLWVGKIKLPKEFLDDITRFKLLDHVKILEITKTGSLKKIHSGY